MESEWKKYNFEESDFVEAPANFNRYPKNPHKVNLDIDESLCSWVFILKFESFCSVS